MKQKYYCILCYQTLFNCCTYFSVFEQCFSKILFITVVLWYCRNITINTNAYIKGLFESAEILLYAFAELTERKNIYKTVNL